MHSDQEDDDIDDDDDDDDEFGVKRTSKNKTKANKKNGVPKSANGSKRRKSNGNI